MTTLPAVRTNYGLTALAAAVQGGYLPPLYLVLENNGSTLVAGINTGVTSFQTPARVDLTGDTQIVLSPGLPSQETVTFTAVTGTGPYTYTLSTGTFNVHALGDPVCRLPLASDTMTQVTGEIEYDPANAPGQRSQSVSGYSTGNGEWTMQFYLTGIQADSYIMTVGLSDSPVIGQGNLHAHLVVATNHVFVSAPSATDLEIDVPLTLS